MTEIQFSDHPLTVEENLLANRANGNIEHCERIEAMVEFLRLRAVGDPDQDVFYEMTISEFLAAQEAANAAIPNPNIQPSAVPVVFLQREGDDAWEEVQVDQAPEAI